MSEVFQLKDRKAIVESQSHIENPIIALRDVTLKLHSEAGPVNVLNGINLEIADGTSVSIMGPSGSGKTSLMMLIGGLDQPTSGSIKITNTLLGGLNEDQLAEFRRDTMGIVFQNYHLVPTMNAVENVAIPVELAGLADPFDRARDALKSVGLEDRTKHYPGQLSGGEQQRVALARAIVNKPKILLADEPTGNLDVKTGETVIDLLFALRADHNATLVLITHNDALAQRCDRKINLTNGRISREENHL